MARIGLLLLALAPATSAPDASAVTVGPSGPRPWNGVDTDPCGTLCDARWALDRMRGVMPPEVHRALHQRLDDDAGAQDYAIVDGDDIRAMSHARQGVPFVDISHRVARFPRGIEHPAHGHFVGNDGVTYRFVRLVALGNWALIVDQGENTASPPSWLLEEPRLFDEFGGLVTGSGGSDTLARGGEDRLVRGGGALSGDAGAGVFAIAPNGPVAHPLGPGFGVGAGFGGFGGGIGGGIGGGKSGGGPGTAHGAPAGSGGPGFPPIQPIVAPPGQGPRTPSEPGVGGPASPNGPGPSPFSPPVGSPPGPTSGKPDSPTGTGPSAPPDTGQDRTGGAPVAPVPLPGSLALVAGWLAALGALRLRRA